VDLPEPEPPAIPIIRGFSIVPQSYAGPLWNALCRFAMRLDPLRAAEPDMKTIQAITLSLLLLAAGACAGMGGGSGNPNPNEPTVVEVDNQGFSDMTVYAVRSSQRYRLGIATGNSKTRLTIPPSVSGGLATLRFIADPIGGRRNPVSQEITIAPGDTVVLMIPPV
jgi:hypothetical protein